MIRVLQLPDSIEKRNGRMSVIMNIYRKIDHSKVQFDFLATDYGKESYYDEIRQLGGKVFLLPSSESSLKNIASLFNKVIHNSNYTFVHYHAVSKWGICITIAHKKGIKVIVHSHATKLSDSVLKSIRNRMFSLNILFDADKRVAVSPEAGRKLFMFQKFNYIPNVIDYSKYSFDLDDRIAIRKKFHIKDHEILIGIVGRLSKQKNQKYALNVLKRLVRNNKQYKMMIVGDYNVEGKKYYSELLNRIKKFSLKDRVIFTGMVSDVDRYYSAFDLFWLTSYYEGLPTVALEAQSNGLSLLVSKSISRKTDITGNVTFLPIRSFAIGKWVNLTKKLGGVRDWQVDLKINKGKFSQRATLKKWEQLYHLTVY